jgi:hypothetical protein
MADDGATDADESLVPSTGAAVGEPAPEHEVEGAAAAAGAPALSEKEQKKAAKEAEKERKKAEKEAEKAEKAAEKERKKAEKQSAKDQKKLEKAAKKAGKADAVEAIDDDAGSVDGVDEESTPMGGPPPSASVTPVDSPVVVTASGVAGELAGGSWKGGAEASAELQAFMAPVSAIRSCAVQRKDKKCLVLVDRDQNNNFLCCARLVQKAKKNMCWRFYKSPQAVTCNSGDLTKDTRLGYFGKLQWSDPAVKPKVQLTLFDHGPGDGRTDKLAVLSMTMKKKKKHAQWKVRAPNMLGVIYRSQIPEWDKGSKKNIYKGMSLNPQESIKNFMLCKENLAAGVASTGSTAGVEIGDNAAATKAAQDAAVRPITITITIAIATHPLTRSQQRLPA